MYERGNTDNGATNEGVGIFGDRSAARERWERDLVVRFHNRKEGRAGIFDFMNGQSSAVAMTIDCTHHC
jgi:hypothetical protein